MGNFHQIFFSAVKKVLLVTIIGGMAYFAFVEPMLNGGIDEYYSDFEADIPTQQPQTDVISQRTSIEKLKTYELVNTIKTGLTVPKDIAINNEGNLIVVGDNQLVVIDPKTSRTIKKALVYQRPVGVCVDRWGTAIISRNQLLYSATDEYKFELLCDFSSNAHLVSIATNKKNFFIADTGLATIHKVSRTGIITAYFEPQSREKREKFSVTQNGKFDVIVGKRGLIWATNPGKGQILSFTASGKFDPALTWGKFGRQISDFQKPYNPISIAMLPDMNFVVSQTNPPSVKVFSETGALTAIIADNGTISSISQALSIACDSKGNVYLLDDRNSQVLVYHKKANTKEMDELIRETTPTSADQLP